MDETYVSQPFYEWGPYVAYGKDPSQEMNISWESEHYALEAWVKYGETEDCSQEVKWEDITPRRHHAFQLAGLTPGTLYYYRISRDGGQDLFSFRTGIPASSMQPFEFCIVGDMHSDHGNITPVFGALDAHAPQKSFAVSVGDAINAGESEASWQDFFRQATPFIHNLPWVHVTGNHDSGSRSKYPRFLATFDQPYVNPREGAYFSFDFANAHFIVLDSCNGGRFESTPMDEQMEWLEHDLTKHAGKNGSGKNKWIFVFLHHQIYSTGDFAMARIMHEYLRPLFDEYHVDAVFYGHDHHFEIFHCSADEPWGGTHYVVTGAASTYDTLDWSIMNPQKKRGEKETGPHYLWLRDEHIASQEFFSGGDVDNKFGARFDEIVQQCQLYGCLRQHFTRIAIEGDWCTLQAVGLGGEIFFEKKIPRTGTKDE